MSSPFYLEGKGCRLHAALWRIDFRVKYEQGICTPVVRGDLVFISGYEQPTHGVRVTKSGDAFTAAQARKNEEATFFMTSPIPCGEFLYGVTQEKKGALVCMAMKDGEVAWTGPTGLGEYATLAWAGDMLLVLATKGEQRRARGECRGDATYARRSDRSIDRGRGMCRIVDDENANDISYVRSCAPRRLRPHGGR